MAEPKKYYKNYIYVRLHRIKDRDILDFLDEIGENREPYGVTAKRYIRKAMKLERNGV